MYSLIFTGLDGSYWSNQAAQAALVLAEKCEQSKLVACHVYAAELHRIRFEEMEPGLPDQYQQEEKLNHLRGTHESLISDGLELISDSYLKDLVLAAQNKNIPVSGLTPEGRNYAVLLAQLANLKPDVVVLGANGHGYIAESQLGSLSERAILGHHGADFLLMRQPWDFKGKPVVVGVDGSQESYQALKKAIQLSRLFDAKLEAIAVYDPFFHGAVFKTISAALPQEQQQRFNFPAQEQLHDEIIDSGLEKLYREGLERALLMAQKEGVDLKIEVLAGKVYPQIHHYAEMRNSGLVVMGRWGLHRDACSLIGSNTHQFLRLTNRNTLVVAPTDAPIEVPQLRQAAVVQIKWTEAAEARMNRVPGFARGMARRSVEEKARALGLTLIDEEFVAKIGGIMNRR